LKLGPREIGTLAFRMPQNLSLLVRILQTGERNVRSLAAFIGEPGTMLFL